MSLVDTIYQVVNILGNLVVALIFAGLCFIIPMLVVMLIASVISR